MKANRRSFFKAIAGLVAAIKSPSVIKSNPTTDLLALGRAYQSYSDKYLSSDYDLTYSPLDADASYEMIEVTTHDSPHGYREFIPGRRITR
jgi:hypothetical protein